MFLDYFKIYYMATVINTGAGGPTQEQRDRLWKSQEAEETAADTRQDSVHHEGASAGQVRGERTEHSVHGAGRTNDPAMESEAPPTPHTEMNFRYTKYLNIFLNPLKYQKTIKLNIHTILKVRRRLLNMTSKAETLQERTR